jgi:hypothetical protein
MNIVQFEKHLQSLSDSELAQQLAQDLGHYKNIMMEPETTMSMPDLNKICMMADELSKRLSN